MPANLPCRSPLVTGAMKPATMKASAALFSSVASNWIRALWTVCIEASGFWVCFRPYQGRW